MQKEARKWAMFCHLSALFFYLTVPLGNIAAPIMNVILPLIFWSLKKDEYELVNDQGKEVINFQLSMCIYLFISGGLVFLFGLGLVITSILILLNFIFTIVGAVKANDGVYFRYPFSIRFIK